MHVNLTDFILLQQFVNNKNFYHDQNISYPAGDRSIEEHFTEANAANTWFP